MTDGPGPPEPTPAGAGRPSEPTDQQVRAAFDEIVAGLTGSSASDAAQQAVPREATPPPDTPPQGTPSAGAPREVGPLDPPTPAELPGWRVHEPAEPPEEHFTPAPPRPLPRDDLAFWLSLVGLVGGPCWLLYLLVVAPYGDQLWRWLAGGLFIAGLVTLMLRSTRDPRDPDDDGARV
ncbi:MAG TPA: hypothetical protein VES01_01855 [Dermatophilaceae bacterium]|nr:hypothetical protein [Dermatophilaceae bacterium]